jgi:O-methyltransferase involved in polyketide biosynthesis
MTTEKIHFAKEKETMLMTLSIRATQSQWQNPILPDPWAVEAMRHIDYDMSQTLTGVSAWPIWKDVGCGMDSRVFRVNPPPSVQWFDVDYPDVVELRRQLFPEREAYQLIGAPLDDLRWLEQVPRDRLGLVLAEGVLHYLNETEVKALLNAVVAHFPGGQILFDICNSMIVKRAGANVGGTGATYKWGLDDPQDIRQLEPKLELVREYKMSELESFSRFPLFWRVMQRLQERSTTLRRMERLVVYKF